MESVLWKTKVDPKDLETPTQKFSAFSSYAPRRSHLESESYRSLVHILSYCFDHSLIPSPPPVRTLRVKNPTSSLEIGDLHLQEEAGVNNNERTPTELQKEGIHCADGGGHEESSVAIALMGLDLDGSDDEFAACLSRELLSNAMSDCRRLIGTPNGEHCSGGESYEGKEQVGHQEIVDKDLEIAKACIDSAVEEVSNLQEVSEVAKDYDGLIDVPNRELHLSAQTQDGNGQTVNEQGDDNDLDISKAHIHVTQEGLSCLGEVCEVANEDVNNKLLNRLMPDCSISNDEPSEKLCLNGESHEGNEQDDRVEIEENGLETTNASIHDAEEGIFNLGKVSAVAKGDANDELLGRIVPDCSRLIDASNGEFSRSSELHDGGGQSGCEDIEDNDMKVTKACIHATKEGFSHRGKVLEFEKGDVNYELHNRAIFDCHRLIGTPSGDHSCTVALDGNGHTAHEEIVDTCPKFPEVIHDAEGGISHLGEASEVFNGDELEKVQPGISEKVCNSKKILEDRRKRAEDVGDLVRSQLVMGANAGASILLGTQNENSRLEDKRWDLVSSEPLKGANTEMSILVEIQNENSRLEGKREVTERSTCVQSTSLMDCLEVRNLEENQRRSLAVQIDEEEFEDGEIPDEIQDLEGPVDGNGKDAVQRPRRFDFDGAASTTTSIHKKEDFDLETGVNTSTVERRVSFDSETDLSDTSEMDSKDEETQIKQMVMKARERKRIPLTEERKAKKKMAKKRKRAQKNREQGVKKLKLPIIMKAKEVKICNFYLMGRCQQGDLCKYSHNTPLIKTAPCKYFACNSCLKGDDCPYDHELSKYPCHKYFSSGSCIRGNECKFSHKTPTTDDASLLKSSKPDSRLASEKPNLKNQPVQAHISPFCIGTSEDNNKGTPSMRRKPSGEANQVPKGIRFLSFGAVRTEHTSKFQEGLPVNKSHQNRAFNQQRQDDLFVHGHHHVALSMTSSGSVGDASSHGFPVKDFGNIIKGSTIAPPGTTNHEVSEATKILEEFLFCGAD